MFSVTDLYAFALGWMHKNTNTTHSRLKKIKIAIDTYRYLNKMLGMMWRVPITKCQVRLRQLHD